MSAHKRALLTPDSAALRRLDDLTAQLRMTSRPDPSTLNAARQEALDHLKKAVSHSEQRQHLLTTRLDDTLSGLDQRMRDLETTTGRALSEQSAQIQSEVLGLIEDTGGALAAQADNLLAAQAEQYARLLDQLQADRQTLFLHQQGRNQAAGQAAVNAIRQASALLDALQQSYPQQNRRWNNLITLLEQAQNNLVAGYAEAALSTAQQAEFSLDQQRVFLEQEWNERSLLQAAAIEQALQAQSLLSANRVVSAIDMEGRSLDFPLDVDYWTDGGWSELNSRIHEALVYLEQPIEALSPKDLRGLMQTFIPGIANKIPGLVAEARRCVLASQLRYNLAEAVLAALSEQGFDLDQASYQEGDMRLSYQLALQNIEGSRLVVTLEPQQESVVHQLDLHSLDQAQRTPHELHQRARELTRTLRRYGLQVRPPESQSEPLVYTIPPQRKPAFQIKERYIPQSQRQ